jgi:phage shock protein C
MAAGGEVFSARSAANNNGECPTNTEQAILRSQTDARSEKGGTTMAGELVRPRNDRMIAGVCGGLARWLGWNSTAVRILYVLVSFFSAAFPGILVYIILAMVMPVEDEV